jgi:uncharacterized membrane protein
MSDKNQLILAVFENEEAADKAAADIKSWDQASDLIKLGGVGVVVKDKDGKVKQAKLGGRQGGKGAGIGMVLGIIWAIPTGGLSLAGGAIAGAVGGAVFGSFFQKGFKFTKEDAQRLDQQLNAGRAVVGVMANDYEARQVTDKLTQLGGKVESHEVTDEALQEAAKTGGTNEPKM